MRYNGLLGGGGQSIILLEAKAHRYLGHLKYIPLHKAQSACIAC